MNSSQLSTKIQLEGETYTIGETTELRIISQLSSAQLGLQDNYFQLLGPQGWRLLRERLLMEIPFITEVGRETPEFESSEDQVAGRTNQGCRQKMMLMFSPVTVKMKESRARVGLVEYLIYQSAAHSLPHCC